MAVRSVYITQHALTAGIRCCELVRAGDDGYVVVKWPGGINGTALFGRAHWSEDAVKATKAADAMRVRKIASLQKQIAKLEKLTFKIPEAQS